MFRGQAEQIAKEIRNTFGYTTSVNPTLKGTYTVNVFDGKPKRVIDTIESVQDFNRFMELH
jgi:hypothetical protein